MQVARAAPAKRNLWRRVDPSLRASLESVREAGFVLGVISNSEGALDVLFREVGLSGLFDEVVDSHYEGIRKPDPRIFRRACERLRVEPERTVYVGDLPAVDVLGAREAGLGAVLVDAYDLYPTYDLVPRFRTAQEVCAWFLAGSPVDRACTEGR